MDFYLPVQKYFSIGIIFFFLVTCLVPVTGQNYETHCSLQSAITSEATIFPTIKGYLPPYVPKNPYPEDNATNIPINIHLSWTGGDPDINDVVTYDVYFGGTLPIQKIAGNISSTSFTPGILADNTRYIWRIVAWGNQSQSTQGPLWHFITSDTMNNPPKKPNRPSGLIKGNVGFEYTYSTSTIDPDGNEPVYYFWDWGDGNYSGWIGPYDIGITCEAKHSWETKGNYSVKVKAKDIYQFESDWSDPFLISMPYSYKSIQHIIKLLFRQFNGISILTR